jgi:hypothetical protein
MMAAAQLTASGPPRLANAAEPAMMVTALVARYQNARNRSRLRC